MKPLSLAANVDVASVGFPRADKLQHDSMLLVGNQLLSGYVLSYTIDTANYYADQVEIYSA